MAHQRIAVPSRIARVVALVVQALNHSQWAIGLGIVGAVLGLAPVLVLHFGFGTPAAFLVRDIFATTGVPVYAGLLSNFGLFTWAAATALWLLNAILLLRERTYHPLMPFSLGSALFTGWLLLDDAFMLHEDLLPRKLGMAEEAIMIAYGFLALAYIVINIRPMLRTAFPIWLTAGFFLALSVGVDVVVPMSATELLIEDSLKFVGIIFWMVYAGAVSLQIVDELRAEGRT